MGWAVWLAIPVVATLVASAVLWWRGRPPRALTTHDAMREHERFLDALVQPAQGPARAPAHPVRE